MTHESAADDEATGGPEQDERLPPAGDVPVTDEPGLADPDVTDDGDA